MPKYGLPEATYFCRGARKPESRRDAVAWLNAPTPGKRSFYCQRGLGGGQRSVTYFCLVKVGDILDPLKVVAELGDRVGKGADVSSSIVENKEAWPRLRFGHVAIKSRTKSSSQVISQRWTPIDSTFDFLNSSRRSGTGIT